MAVKDKFKDENIQRVKEIRAVAKKYNLIKLLSESRKPKSGVEEYEEEIDPANLRLAFEELGPAYVKLGQMLCTRPDLIGNEIAEELKKLRDNTPTTPFDEIRKVIEKQIGKPLEEVYSEFNEEPLGSASIGQVYKAHLKEEDIDVAVKVQKPNSYEVVAADVKIMEYFAEKADKYITKTRTFNLPMMVSEFERSIFKELDYMEEVMNIQKFAKNFENVEYIKTLSVFPQYCSNKLITMELVKGHEIEELFNSSIEELFGEEFSDIDNKTIANYGVQSYFKQVMLDGFFHADPHPGNLIITQDAKLCYLDLGMVGILNEEFRSDLAQLILLLLDGNSKNLIKQLTYMKIITPEQNTEELKMDIDDLLNRYMGAELDQMDGILGKLIDTMIKHNVLIPREFVMIGRGVALIEDAGHRLDPNFNAAAELERFSKKLVLHKLDPKGIAAGSFNYMLEVEHLLKDLPDRLNSTLYKIEKGEIEVNINHTGLTELKNQVSASLIISALIIGSALAILADKGPKMWDVSAIGLFGFLISAIFGIYIVIKYVILDD